MEQNRYAAILIDPPWEFKVWNKDTGSERSPSAHYPTMTLDDLKALPVQNLLADDCAVFMWATWPTLFDAVELASAWGLKYKTCAFNWVKMNKVQTDKPFTGMGYWTRANSEPCLLFTKGKPQRVSKAVQQIMLEWEDFETETLATPIRRHSQKPDEIYGRIEALVSGPYLEMFARQKFSDAWDVWGNEVESTLQF